MKTCRLIVTASVLLTVGLTAAEIILPSETARLTESSLPGFVLATTHCYTCHSVDYVRMQPVSTRAYWKSSVAKMQKTFGAPIPDSAVDPLVDYLVKTYGMERSGTSAPAANTAPKK